MDGSNTTTLEELRQHPHLVPAKDRFARKGEAPAEDEGEASCAAFGFLRGIRDRALFLELRFRNGNTESFPYGSLAQVSFNPSVGLLLKFTGDLVYLVLIRGSNLDTVAPGRTVNLTDRGINWHRVTFLCEMDEDESRRAGEGEPTIDRIEVAEFESNEELKEWLKKNAPAFVRPGLGPPR